MWKQDDGRPKQFLSTRHTSIDVRHFAPSRLDSVDLFTLISKDLDSYVSNGNWRPLETTVIASSVKENPKLTENIPSGFLIGSSI